MAAGVVAAVGAAVLYNLSVVLQKSQAQLAETSGVRILLTLARRPVWLLGILVQMIGFACHFFALTRAPVTVVQPIIAAGIVFVVVFAALILDEHPGRRELAGMLGAISGVAILLATLGEETAMAPISAGVLAATLGAIAATIAVLIVIATRRQLRETTVTAVVAGLSAGLAFGASDAMNRLMGAWLSPGDGWAPPVALGVAAGVLLLGFGLVGFVVTQNALKTFRANTVVPSIAVPNMLVPVAVATLVYGQALPAGVGLTTARIVAIGLILAGVVVLSTSERVAATFTEAR